jgi:hypothetical protein
MSTVSGATHADKHSYRMKTRTTKVLVLGEQSSQLVSRLSSLQTQNTNVSTDENTKQSHTYQLYGDQYSIEYILVSNLDDAKSHSAECNIVLIAVPADQGLNYALEWKKQIERTDVHFILVLDHVDRISSDEDVIRLEGTARRFCQQNEFQQWITISAEDNKNVQHLLEQIALFTINNDLEHGSKKSASLSSLNDIVQSDGNTGIFEELGLKVETAELVTKGLTALSSRRLKYPFMSATQTLAIHMALYLRAHNPRYSKERLERCAAHLAQFEKECQIIPFFADYKERLCKIREQIADDSEREQYTQNAQLFNDIQHKKHQIPGSQLF